MLPLPEIDNLERRVASALERADGLVEIRQKRDVDINLSQITKLPLGIVARLDVVEEQIGAFRSYLDQTKTRLSQLQHKIKVWLFAGECLILLLIPSEPGGASVGFEYRRTYWATVSRWMPSSWAIRVNVQPC